MAVSFAEGTPDYITYAMSGNMQRPGCVSMWVKPSTTGTFWNSHQAVLGNSMSLKWDAGTTKFSGVMVGSATITGTSTNTFAAGSWYHILCLYDDLQAGTGNDYILMWVDGSSEIAQYGTINGMGTLARMNIGAAKAGADPCTCSVAEVMFWQSAATASLVLPDQPNLDALARRICPPNVPWGYPYDNVSGELMFWDRLIGHNSTTPKPHDLIRKQSATLNGSPAYDADHPPQIYNRRLAG